MTSTLPTLDDTYTDTQRDQDAAALELAEQAAPRHARAEHAAPVQTRVSARIRQLEKIADAMDAKDARIAELEALNGSQAQALADADERIAELARTKSGLGGKLARVEAFRARLEGFGDPIAADVLQKILDS